MSDSSRSTSDDPSTTAVADRREHAADDSTTPPPVLGSGAPRSARPFVVAVVVAHNGARWADDLAAGRAAQTHPPDRIVLVDTGSRDETAAALAAALPTAEIVAMDRRSSFGAAVARGALTAWDSEPATSGIGQGAGRAPGGEADDTWLWVLHDDCVPAPEALEALLAAATDDDQVGVVGPKVRDYANRRQLLEVGLTIARSGRRETGRTA